MGAMAEDSTSSSVPERLIDATIALLAEHGPSAIKARAVAEATGLSTMVVYSHFGGVPELTKAVADRGFAELERTFVRVPVTEDPIADLFTMALQTREIARANPHLYDLMFGLSTRATYRPASERDLRRSGHSPAFQSAYVHLIAACARLGDSGRVGQLDPRVIASALWSFVHGFITLELGDHFLDFKDPVTQVLLPMGVTFSVGMGDKPEHALASHLEALEQHRKAQRRLKRRKA